jgi:hypothetical protein
MTPTRVEIVILFLAVILVLTELAYVAAIDTGKPVNRTRTMRGSPMITVGNKRVKPFTHYIGRGSVFGNPFTHLPLAETKAAVHVNTVEDACTQFYRWAHSQAPWVDLEPERRVKMLRAIAALPPDAVLGCYCDKPPCHGYEIVRLHAELYNGTLLTPKLPMQRRADGRCHETLRGYRQRAVLRIHRLGLFDICC